MPRNRPIIAALAATAALAAGCTDVKESLPSRTATEQLLISSAADNAANRLRLDLPADKRAFLDTGNFDGTDAKYAASAIKESLLRQGVRLVPDRAAADTIIEIRLGALSVNQSKTVLGIPPSPCPAQSPCRRRRSTVRPRIRRSPNSPPSPTTIRAAPWSPRRSRPTACRGSRATGR
ncbi:DUF6655 family protein [Azospirillum formosense]|uniref:DUF6655 family protein n=1 Tax=Azospirillum formosense TaxID=861533 RepID=UPI001C917120|nr:DUF6655 family protein [Azospirillum formosense]MBY3756441.1 hypothetical protein [Azospirillum formosense]